MEREYRVVVVEGLLDDAGELEERLNNKIELHARKSTEVWEWVDSHIIASDRASASKLVVIFQRRKDG